MTNEHDPQITPPNNLQDLRRMLNQYSGYLSPESKGLLNDVLHHLEKGTDTNGLHQLVKRLQEQANKHSELITAEQVKYARQQAGYPANEPPPPPKAQTMANRPPQPNRKGGLQPRPNPNGPQPSPYPSGPKAQPLSPQPQPLQPKPWQPRPRQLRPGQRRPRPLYRQPYM